MSNELNTMMKVFAKNGETFSVYPTEAADGTVNLLFLEYNAEKLMFSFDEEGKCISIEEVED